MIDRGFTTIVVLKEIFSSSILTFFWSIEIAFYRNRTGILVFCQFRLGFAVFSVFFARLTVVCSMPLRLPLSLH